MMEAIALSWVSRMMCGTSGAAFIVGLVLALAPVPVNADEYAGCSLQAPPNCTAACGFGQSCTDTTINGQRVCKCLPVA